MFTRVSAVFTCLPTFKFRAVGWAKAAAINHQCNMHKRGVVCNNGVYRFFNTMHWHSLHNQYRAWCAETFFPCFLGRTGIGVSAGAKQLLKPRLCGKRVILYHSKYFIGVAAPNAKRCVPFTSSAPQGTCGAHANRVSKRNTPLRTACSLKLLLRIEIRKFLRRELL